MVPNDPPLLAYKLLCSHPLQWMRVTYFKNKKDIVEMTMCHWWGEVISVYALYPLGSSIWRETSHHIVRTLKQGYPFEEVPMDRNWNFLTRASPNSSNTGLNHLVSAHSSPDGFQEMTSIMANILTATYEKPWGRITQVSCFWTPKL